MKKNLRKSKYDKDKKCLDLFDVSVDKLQITMKKQ